VSGKPTKFTVSVTAQSGSGTPTGTVDIFAGGQQCTITLPGTNCSLTLSGNGTITVTAVYNGDANFAGDGISKTTPVVSQTTVFLDQFGLTGTWYNAATSGQGFLLVSYPDLAGAGTGVIAGGWFTFDVVSGGADKQRWYSFSGNARSIDAQATL
ncbi:MAG: Ig-like domain repeat protein, partial [Gammaproteobacteria bacterium]